MSRIPATVVTGFLGAGKTSLLRHLVQTSGRRLALVINEFGEVGMDRELLLGCAEPRCREGDVIELANGCICCTVADDFLPVMEALLARPDAPDHIVIETSGLALPKPLLKAFAWPQVRTRTTVDGVIAVIDAPAVAAGGFAADADALAAARAADPSIDHLTPVEELFADQVATADLIVLNKSDLAGAEAITLARARLAPHLRAGVSALAATHGRLDARVLLGLGAAAEGDLGARATLHGDGVHDHDDFESFLVEPGPVTDPDAFAARVAAVAARHGVLRLKGFLDVPGRALRHAVQAVGPRVAGYYDRPWKVGETRHSRLVVIGRKGLDRAAIAAALMS
jgi:cobalamin biosynthesis protein CobW